MTRMAQPAAPGTPGAVRMAIDKDFRIVFSLAVDGMPPDSKQTKAIFVPFCPGQSSMPREARYSSYVPL
ncbi:hypothetical protein GCM10009097_04080 [Pigmentiphaga daeguensis]|uniref:Uncharacterized protein n=1 Tax=Pigmentiphaga daeguensis TaxID=414049 RepID=A0ABN1B825_9BURK